MSPFEVAVLAIAAMFFVAAIVVLAKPTLSPLVANYR
jgi:hypothetical protein